MGEEEEDDNIRLFINLSLDSCVVWGTFASNLYEVLVSSTLSVCLVWGFI